MTAADVPSVPDLVRDAVRAKHAPCDPKVCPLARVWADDVREIIEVADRVRREAGDGTAESHVEYRVTGFDAKAMDRPVTCTTRDADEAETWAAYWRARWIDVHVESRTVTTTRVETPWKAEQTSSSAEVIESGVCSPARRGP